MDALIVNIISYLKYLNNECRLNVSVHFKEQVFRCFPGHVTSWLLPFNCHTNAYCVKIKSTMHHKCLLNQKEILTRCKKNQPFCQVCHAAVYEYIYPIYKGAEASGFIAVSGYRKKNASRHNISDLNVWEQTLKPEIPLELCNAVIPPLCIMMEQMLLKCLSESSSEYSSILQYLTEYHTNITLADLARHFGRSKSYISHLFKKESGMSLRAYCNSLKLEDAETLLLNTDIPITEIALDVGFNDTSYFIHLFKKQFGISPLQYRRKQNTV